MKSLHVVLFFILASLTCTQLISQNETKKWCLWLGGALDFMTNPPTNFSGPPSNAPGILASVADSSGNLLFYATATNIYTNTYSIMPNGNGLNGMNGNNNMLIVKKPGSNTLYYIFVIRYNLNSPPDPDGLYYSIVDISLAAGQGSVVAKNVPIHIGPLCKKLTGTKHCNGTDTWIVTKDCSNSNTLIWNGIYSFRSFSLTAAGISTVASVSNFTYTTPNMYAASVKMGQMKISPNGKKLACANYAFHPPYDPTVGSFELYDFNNATGQVSNYCAGVLPPSPGGGTPTNRSAFGLEFSPDATKLYGTLSNNYFYPDGSILQWDLCQVNNCANFASQSSIVTPTSLPFNGFGCMQLASDGKIYVANYGAQSNSISVINNPNALGGACAFSMHAQSVAPALNTGYYLPNFMGSQFFLAASIPSFSQLSAPASGCLGYQFQSPNIPISSCPTNTYTLSSLLWNFGDPLSGANNTSTLSNPTHTFSSTGIYNVQLTLNFGCSGTSYLTQTINVGPGAGPLVHTNTLNCFGANTGTATFLNPPNPNLNYYWTNGTSNYSTQTVSGLSAGTWTTIVTNTLQGCQDTTIFTILQQPAINIVISTPTLCFSNTLSANASGGNGPLSYLWPGGSTVQVYTPTQSGVNTLTVTDLFGCSTTKNFTVYSLPQLIASGATICAGQHATLQASGANNYTWSAGMVVSPTISTNYSVTGESNGCYANASVAVVVNTLPLVGISASSQTLCTGVLLTLTASGAQTYNWSNGATGSVISYGNSTPGTYTIQVTGINVNSCSNTASLSIKVLDCVATEINEELIERLLLYPNPVDEMLILEGNTEAFNFSFHDLLGRETKVDYEFGPGKILFDCSHLEPGIYFLIIKKELEKSVKKIVKQ